MSVRSNFCRDEGRKRRRKIVRMVVSDGHLKFHHVNGLGKSKERV